MTGFENPKVELRVTTMSEDAKFDLYDAPEFEDTLEMKQSVQASRPYQVHDQVLLKDGYQGIIKEAISTVIMTVKLNQSHPNGNQNDKTHKE